MATIPNNKIIAALLATNTIAQAAKMAGCTERTIYNRLAQPEFKEAVRAAQRNIVNTSTGHIMQSTQAAADYVIKLINDDDVSPSVRLKAALEALNIGQYQEQQDKLLAEIEKLKKRVGDNE